MSTSWSALGVPERIVAGLLARDITSPFPVQAATLPDALQGHDICGKAPTGSGKTLAFGIALALKVEKSKPGRPQGLVLVPTRELAAQVAKEVSMLCSGSDIRVAAVYGGAGYGPQVKAARAASIVVATPGRLEDLIKRRDLDLGAVALAVIDEADRMADMGFMPAVKRIMRAVSKNRQTLLFSATLDGDVDALIKEFQNAPRGIRSLLQRTQAKSITCFGTLGEKIERAWLPKLPLTTNGRLCFVEPSMVPTGLQRTSIQWA